MQIQFSSIYDCRQAFLGVLRHHRDNVLNTLYRSHRL